MAQDDECLLVSCARQVKRFLSYDCILPCYNRLITVAALKVLSYAYDKLYLLIISVPDLFLTFCQHELFILLSCDAL